MPLNPSSEPPQPASPAPSTAANATNNGVCGATTEAATQPDFPAPGTAAWGVMNRRRAELIHKKNREGLSPEEQDEYDRLQRGSQIALEEAFPGTAAEEAHRRLIYSLPGTYHLISSDEYMEEKYREAAQEER